ncbi:MAG: secretin N-terminal domain-containing protein, partial [Planctomycetota bacterium]
MSGLAIMGDPPSGKVTFKTTEVMDFKTAYNRIRLLLFKHRDNCWMVRDGKVLEVTRMTEIPRIIPFSDIFPNVAAFEAAERDDNDLVMLLYAPEAGSVEDLVAIRDYLPDYVRSAPLEDRNVMPVFALVKDIKKFLALVKLFRDVETADPRAIKAIPLQHVMPSYALESLGRLMDLSGTGAARPSRSRSDSKRKAPPTVIRGPSRGISLLPDDAQRVLIVRALQSEIDEIERLLPFIDVPLEGDFEPVIIPLQYVTADEIMSGLQTMLTPAAAPRTGTDATKRKGGRPRRTPAGPAVISTTEVTIFPDRRNNRLIVEGSEEEVARVRAIVAVLDVASDLDQPTAVKLVHAEAEAIAQRVVPFVQQIHPPQGQDRPFTATPDEASNSVLLIGTAPALELAMDLIAQWDVEGAEPTLHTYRLANAKPSDVANMLLRVESGQSAAPAPQRTDGKKKGRAPRPRRSSPATGNFIGDDAHGILYVLCTDEEWQDEYLPLIEEFDANAEPALQTHVIALTEADPQTVISTLSDVIGADPQAAVTMLAVAEGIMLINASEAQIEQLADLAAALDVDPDELRGIERRIFQIEHRTPAEVRDVILTMMSSAPAPAPPSGGKGGRKRTPRRPTMGADSGLRIVEVGQSLMVSAPAEKMTEIAELIAQVDVGDAETEIRIYPFPPGVNVQEVASALGQLVSGTPGRAPKGKRGGGRVTTVGGISIVPQPAASKILVSAPSDRFEDIEEAIALLGTPTPPVGIAYEFIDVAGGNAAAIVQLVQPMLQAKLSQLMATGEISRPAGAGPKAPKQSLLTIQADSRGDRIVLAAPDLIVAEAKSLVAALDRPDDGERVMRTVTLERSDPQEMAQTVAAMLTGRRAAPMRPKGKGRPSRPIKIDTTGSELDVMVTPAPGGGAIVLMGAARDVEEVEGWIKMLDQTAEGTGKIVKVYDLRDADPEQVADTLIAVVDSGTAKQTRAPKRTEEELWEPFSAEVTRQGKDIYITANTITATMIVAAAPAKMREVDEMVALFVGTDEVEGILPAEVVTPYMTFELQNAEAFDAVFTLEGILDALWVPADDKPSVDYIPFTNILVVKGNPERFKEVEDLIVKYVDKGTGKPPVSRSVKTVVGLNMTAGDLAALLKARLGSVGLKVDVDQLDPLDVAPELERVHPCLLPPWLFEGLMAVTVDQVGNDEEPGGKGQSPELNGQEGQDEAGAILDELMEAQKRQDQEAEAARSPETKDRSTDGRPPEQISAGQQSDQVPPSVTLTIRYDDISGVIYLEGPSAAIDDAEDLIKEIKEEAKDLPSLPDIRIYRLKYKDVNQAAEVLEAMFNDRQLRAQQQQMLRQQQQQQQRAARQRQQQQQQQGKGQQGQPGQRGQQQGQQPQAPQVPPLTVRVYPDPRARTLTIRAATELFPQIEELLGSIDKEPTEPLDYKIFALEKHIAADVEAQIKEMFGVGGSRTAPRRRTARSGQPRGQQQGQQGVLQMELPGGQTWTGSAQNITVTSNAATNTVMVMAPKEAMELVERFINDMEGLEAPKFVTKTYELKHADVTETVPQVEKLFKKSGPRGGGGVGAGGINPADVNAPIFMADPRTNSIIVRALEIDLPKIEPLITQLDVELPDQAVREYVLTNAD